MRNALPNAAFIGFTGTPLMAGEERTKEVFGDYVIDLQLQAVDRGRRHGPALLREPHPRTATGQRELQRRTSTTLIDEAELDEDQEKQAGAGVRPRVPPDHPRRPAGEDRRRHRGALHRAGACAARRWSISIDKATAVRMYDKVQKHWKAYLAELKAELPLADPIDRPELEARHRATSRRPTWRWWSPSPERDRGVQEEGPRHRHAPQADGRRKTWRRSSRTPTTRSESSSSVPCGSPASTCRRARRSTSTSR